MIGSYKDIEKCFENLVDYNSCSVEQNSSVINYIIKTKYKFTIVIAHELEDSMYTAYVKYTDGANFEITMYDEVKEFIKKKTKRLFKKADFQMHLSAVDAFITENLDVFYESHTLEVFFSGKVRGFGKIFI